MNTAIRLEFKESIAPALGMSYGGRIAILPGQGAAEEFSTLVVRSSGEGDVCEPVIDVAARLADYPGDQSASNSRKSFQADDPTFNRLYEDEPDHCYEGREGDSSKYRGSWSAAIYFEPKRAHRLLPPVRLQEGAR